MKTDVVKECVMPWEEYRTWYKVVQGPCSGESGMLPLVICHGGPGLTHDYLLPIAELSRSGRRCVFYDQFGNGRSGHLRAAPAEFWTVDLFVRELENLVEYLGLSGGFHVLGHSWGGMLALELAARRPAGLRSIVVADAYASSRVYVEETARLLAGLPEQTRSAIRRHEAAGTTESPEYQDAMRVFYGRHVCRARPVPSEVKSALAAIAGDPTVYQTMIGPSEFSMTGTLRDWDITDRLRLIEVPALLVSGRHDQVTPRAVEPLRRGLANSRWVIFGDSSHMPHVEEPGRFIEVTGDFLRQRDMTEP